MIALIYDDSSSIQGNVSVAGKAEFDELISSLPANWYGELREGHSGRKLQDHYRGLYAQVECKSCHLLIIEQRMKHHIYRNHKENE